MYDCSNREHHQHIGMCECVFMCLFVFINCKSKTSVSLWRRRRQRLTSTIAARTHYRLHSPSVFKILNLLFIFPSFSSVIQFVSFHFVSIVRCELYSCDVRYRSRQYTKCLVVVIPNWNKTKCNKHHMLFVLIHTRTIHTYTSTPSRRARAPAEFLLSAMKSIAHSHTRRGWVRSAAR